MNLRDHKTVKNRREALEKEVGVTLKNIGSFSLDESTASTRNCENMIGVAQIPLGIAGPLVIRTQNSEPNDQEKRKEYYLPLATTEGALVASVNRGCKAITGSGGAEVANVRAGVTRGPVFKVHNLKENSELYDFLDSHRPEFDAIAKKTSGHILFMGMETDSAGLYRFVRFAFNTEDAMGLNMVTIATEAICKYIEEHTGATCISLSGNYCVDKKASWLNVAHGRGYEVWSEVVIPAEILESTLKTSAKHMYEVWLAKCMIGSAMSGSMGFNAQYANIVAAIFLATGQDPAHVVEGSMGITTTEIVNGNDLYISIHMPDLLVGTVGGGTGLATQKESLNILGVQHAEKFAEIIAGAVLAGEISLLASLSVGTLAASHEKLARGKK